jgi:hypothetical protein
MYFIMYLFPLEVHNVFHYVRTTTSPPIHTALCSEQWSELNWELCVMRSSKLTVRSLERGQMLCNYGPPHQHPPPPPPIHTALCSEQFRNQQHRI